MEDNEYAAHIARNWPTEDKRPDVDPEAKKELDALWEKIHGSQVKDIGKQSEGSQSGDT